MAVVLFFAALEWANLCMLRRPWALLYAGAIAALFLLSISAPARWVFVAAAAFWFLVAPAWMSLGVRRGHRAGLVAAGLAVLVPPGLAIVTLQPLDVLRVLILVWVADSAAYFVGRAYGRHRLAPSISPGKTWEGAAGGLLGGLAWAIIWRYWLQEIAWGPFLAAAALLVMISIVGDLFESSAKRQAGVKDSGSVLPGHGGLLDRIDSATAVLPLAALFLGLARGAS